ETKAGSLSPPILARLAGDEFTMLFPGVGSEEEAQRVATRGLDALAEPFRIGKQVSRLSGSIGIALGPEHGTDLPDLMKAADLAMYQAKAQGGARACLFGSAAEALRIARLARAS